MTWRRDGSTWEAESAVGPVKLGGNKTVAANGSALIAGVANQGSIQAVTASRAGTGNVAPVGFGAAKFGALRVGERDPVAAATGTVIGANCLFRGRLDLQGRVQIDGTVEGDIVVEGELIIGPTGIVKANILATRAIISGRLTGDIRCEERLELQTGAYLTGDIAAPQVVMEDGVVFDGRCWMERDVVDEGLPSEFSPSILGENRRNSEGQNPLELDANELEPS